MSISPVEHDQRHPERDDQDRQVGQEEIVQVLAGEIAGRSSRQDGGERGDGDGDGDLAAVTGHDSGSSAIARIVSAVASARERTPAIVPRRITAIRSLMPRISGNSDEIIRIASPRSARS